MRAWYRTSRRIGIIFPLPWWLLFFVWPIFIVVAVWKFTGDKSINSWIRFVVGLGFWILVLIPLVR